MKNLRDFYLDYLYEIKHQPSQWWEAACFWIAWHLPKKLVSCCYIRVMVHATTGEYGSTDVSSVTGSEILKRWYEDPNTIHEVPPEQKFSSAYGDAAPGSVPLEDRIKFQHVSDPESKKSVLLIWRGDDADYMLDVPVPTVTFSPETPLPHKLSTLFKNYGIEEQYWDRPVVIAMELLRIYVNDGVHA